MPISLILVIGGLIATPILWLPVSYLCAQVPLLATFLHKLFWGICGEIEIFSGIASILENALSYQQITGEYVFLSLLEMLTTSIMDSFIMGLCMFATKSIFAKFSRNGLLIIPASQLVKLLGLIIGILLSQAINIAPETSQALLSFFMCLVLFCVGFALMLGKPFRAHYTGRRNLTIATMLIRILIDANQAWCYAALIVCCMEGPHIVQSTGNMKAWLSFYGIILIIYFVLDSLIFFMSPDAHNNA